MTRIDDAVALVMLPGDRRTWPPTWSARSATMRSGTTPIGRKSIPTWQDRFRDPSLTALLVIQICLMFVVAPLVAEGLPMAPVFEKCNVPLLSHVPWGLPCALLGFP